MCTHEHYRAQATYTVDDLFDGESLNNRRLPFMQVRIKKCKNGFHVDNTRVETNTTRAPAPASHIVIHSQITTAPRGFRRDFSCKLVFLI